jgi:hypothetical protein
MLGFFRRAFVALVERQSSSVLPAVCQAVCSVYIIQFCFISSISGANLNTDNAYIAAQEVGKNPVLCAPNSSFSQDYEACANCIRANGDTNSTLLSNVTSEFQPFISFCEAAPAQTETGGAAPTYLSAAKSSLLAQASSLGLTLVSTVQITVTVAQPPTCQRSLTPLKS